MQVNFVLYITSFGKMLDIKHLPWSQKFLEIRLRKGE